MDGFERITGREHDGLVEKCQENGWLKVGGFDWQDDPFLEEYPYEFSRTDSVDRLREALGSGNWAIRQGFDLMAEEGYRSPTVTTVTNTRRVDVEALNAYLAGEQMEISNGYGVYKDKAFRIAHMGEVQDGDLDRLFAAIERFLEKVEG